MPSLNIYIPDDLDLALRTHRGDIKPSQVCADALRAAVSARAEIRSIDGLFVKTFQNATNEEQELMYRYKVRRAIVGYGGRNDDPRDTVAFFAGDFLDRIFTEG